MSKEHIHGAWQPSIDRAQRVSETNKYRLLFHYEGRLFRFYHQSLQTLLRLQTKNDESNLIPFSNTAQSQPEPHPAPLHVKVYMEGWGDHNRTLQIQCRRGFSGFFPKAGLAGRMPRVVACGGRQQALDSSCVAHQGARADEFVALLVDSEGPVAGNDDAWDHVGLHPPGASGDQIHLMVQAMEAWFHADKNPPQVYDGQGFRAAALSQRPDIGNIAKAGLFAGLKQARKSCQKGEYSKGQDSFRILALTDPAKVKAASAYAARLLEVLNRESAR